MPRNNRVVARVIYKQIMIERNQTKGEEIANSITHGIFLLATIFVMPVLISKAVSTGRPLVITSTTIFAVTVILVYFISTLYHAMPRNKVKDTLRIIDHGAIYLLIAGTYTPFALNVIQGSWGWFLFSTEWIIATIGIVLLVFTGLRYSRLSLLFYLIMGWLIVVAIKPLWLNMPVWGILLIFLGGMSYSLGVLFYRVSHLNFRHFIWHLFVILGTTFHIIAVYYYGI